MLSVTTEEMHLKQFDIKTAFLYGTLKENVYMKQPEGFDDGSGRVCKLMRSLYGLKQAPRCCNMRFVDFLTNLEFMQSVADPCLFIRQKGVAKLMVALYVDDGLIVGSDLNDINNFILELQKQFKITINSTNYFVGMQISKLKCGSIFIDQKVYTQKILDRFNMNDANSVATPAECSANNTEDDDVMPAQGIPYRDAVGSLMYLAIATRPDIAYAVSRVSETLENPTILNWKAVKRIFRYLKGSVELGILYERESSDKLEAFSDADYAGDLESRRSRSGIVCKFKNGAISWSSRKQSCVVLSTMEAEYIAASEAVKELVWQKRLFLELLGQSCIPTVYVDNLSAVKLIKNPEFHKRSKHIDIKFHFVREEFSAGEVNIEHISGDNQVADIFTKALPRVKFEKMRYFLGVRNNTCEI